MREFREYFDETNGYILVLVNNKHPLFPDHRVVAKHRLMMAEHLGRPLKSSEIVHHKDHNKMNNVVSNFEIVGRAEHMVEHNPTQFQTAASQDAKSRAAARIGADPEERKRRSERAKAQHAAGNFGAATRSYHSKSK